MSNVPIDNAKGWTKDKAGVFADMIETANTEFDTGYTTTMVYHVSTGDGSERYDIVDEGTSIAIDGKSLECYYDRFAVEVTDDANMCLMYRKQGTLVASVSLRMTDIRPWSDTLIGVSVYGEDNKPKSLERWYSEYIDRQIAQDLENGELEL